LTGPRRKAGRLDLLAGILFLVILVAMAGPCQGKSDPATWRIRILYIGDGWGPSPVPYYHSDPAFTVTSVPTSEFHVGHGAIDFDIETMRKFVRLYMPRNLEHLLAEYDLIILSDANLKMMDTKHVAWMHKAVGHNGFGLVMVGGLESFGAPRAEPWTPLEDLLPVNIIPGSWVYRDFKVEPAIDHPFTRSLPWQTIPYFHGTNMIRLKQAATLLLKSKQIGYPPLSFWQYGKGRSVAHSSDWTPGGGTDVMRWEYYPDYVANIAYLACQEEIPQDAQLMHQLRTSFWATRSRLTSVVDTINFAERFGANTNKIERRLAEVREMVRDAESLYIRHQYDSARETIRRIDQLIIKLQEQAIQIKDRALFWIYVVEWSVTTGTALLAGLGLWALMVRRKLYREVETTRSAG